VHIFLFSYNRGRYLRNCLISLHKHAPDYPVTVVDDGSSDPLVEETLDEFQDSISVLRAATRDEAYLGGLYSNMQWALELAEEELALFIQDDMQLVRDLEPRDEAHWQRFFETHPDAIELGTHFLKPSRRADSSSRFILDRQVPIYFRNPRYSRRAYFTAVGVFHTGRMKALDWRFAATEGENNQQAQALGARLGITPFPFMMWLPNAESSKFRRRGLLHRFAEWYRDCGFYPYASLRDEQIDWLWQRDPEKLPFATEILSPRGLNPDAPWLFEDATKSLRWIHRHLKKKKKRQAAVQQGKSAP